ncbi:Uncharacterised protein [Mycobacterium tuberculosis]|nr:Uncharacterised protein [Mycobacterium tuberculosis]CNN35105.1 Uncharacterised protein [Mycobacterium tuberculosis]
MAPAEAMADRVFEYAGFVSRVPAGFGLPSGLRKYLRASGSSRSCGAASEMAAPILALMSKPPSASVTAGPKRSRQGVRPCSLCTISSIRRMPGTPIDRPEARALGLGALRSTSLTQRR